MQFNQDLIKGKLVQRYKRFMADVELEDGAIVTAHCANSGAMYGVKEPGLPVYLSPATNPDRKLKFTWEFVAADGTFVGVNTSNPNRIIKEALENKLIPDLAAYDTVKPEVKYGTNSRIDFLLTQPDLPDCYVEVKNVHMMREKGMAEFPDSVTARGAKHLMELIEVKKQGMRAVMLYLIQRNDCQSFALAGDIDPTYAQNAQLAVNAGVEFLAYTCHITEKAITLHQPLKVTL